VQTSDVLSCGRETKILKRSNLYLAEESLGAKFAENWGWEMVSSFADVATEVTAVRHTVGLIDLSFHGAMRIGGKEAIQFLQGLVTNDVKSLSKGKGMRAAFLTGHGKVKAFCYILSLGEEFLIVNDPQTHEKVFDYVFPFSYAGDFQVEDVSVLYKVLSVQGPNSLLVMKEICFEPVPELPEYGWIETLIAGHRVMVVKHTRTGELGFDILAHPDHLQDIWDFVLLKGKFHSIIPFGTEALDILRIEAGIPIFGIDISEANMMLEANLPDAVSFTKGCYTGQEAVAMATYRGHVSKRLSGLLFDEMVPVKVGDKVYKGEKEIGFLSSVVNSISLGKTISFSCLKYGFFDAGTTVEVKSDTNSYPASVANLPFINNNMQ
jgi:folate-binding protein YgfZ